MTRREIIDLLINHECKVDYDLVAEEYRIEIDETCVVWVNKDKITLAYAHKEQKSFSPSDWELILELQKTFESEKDTQSATYTEETGRIIGLIEFLRETYKDNTNEVGWPESLPLYNHDAHGTIRVGRAAISLDLLIFRPMKHRKDLRTDNQKMRDLAKEMEGGRLIELKKKKATLERELKELDDDINYLETVFGSGGKF